MSEHDTQSHLVQHIIASFLFFGINTFSDLLETELVALPGRRACVGEGGSLPMGHLKQLEYGGKSCAAKSFNDSNLLNSDPGVAKESSATTLRRRTCARERDTDLDEGVLQTMRDEARQQHPPTFMLQFTFYAGKCT